MQRIRLFVSVCLLLCVCRVAIAEPVAGSIRVVDRSGQPVVAAIVEITNGTGDLVVRLETDENGVASPSDLPAGDYRVHVSAPEFRPYRSRLSFKGDTEPLEIVLAPIGFAQQVEVTSTLPDFATESRLERERLEEQGSNDLAESMRREPGMDAFRRGPINIDPSLRGLQETEVGVFVDGTRTFAAGPGRMDSELSHVSLHAIETTRVVKGPYALIWGAGTMSAIQVETYRPDFGQGSLQTEGRVGLNYRSNAEAADGLVSFGGASRSVSFNVFANYRSGSDYTAGDGSTVPGDYQSGDLRWTVGVKTGERSSVHYTGGYQQQQDIDYPGRLLDATYFYTRSHALDFDWSPSGGGWTLSGRAYVNSKDHLMNNDNKPTAQPDPGRVPPFPIEVDLPAESNTWGAQLMAEVPRGDLTWKFGTDYYHLEQNAQRTITRRDTGMQLAMLDTIVWPDAVIQDLGVFAQAVHSKPRRNLGATVRVDFVDVTAGETSPFFQANTAGSTDQQETNWSAAVSGDFRVAERWWLNAGLGRAVRTASAIERFADRFPYTKFQIAAEFMGDPEIRPETSHEVNLGIKGNYDRLEVVVDVFYRVIDDYIDVLPDPTLPPLLPLSPPLVYRHINGDQARFVGGEAAIRHRLGAGFQWRGSLSYVRAEDTFFDEPVFGIPPLRGQLAVRWGRSVNRDYWVEAALTAVDSQNRVADIRFEVPTAGYTVYDLFGAVEIADGLLLRAGVQNVTDKNYVDHLNSLDPFAGSRIPEIGRNAFVGVGYRF